MIREITLCLVLSLLPFTNGIVGGFPASPGQFSYTVSIRNKLDDHLCGGTIINNRTVLTAGHCIRSRRPEDILIVAGTNKLSDDSSKTYKVKNVAVRGHWRKIHFSYDISILKLSEDIQFSNLIQPLPLHLSETPVNASMVVAGWGFKHLGEFEFANELQYQNVTTIPLNECRDKFINLTIGNNVSEKNICTFTKYGEGVCTGDSGGPLVYEGKLVGIVSYGIPCAVGYPDIFIRVSAFYDWIEQMINIM